MPGAGVNKQLINDGANEWMDGGILNKITPAAGAHLTHLPQCLAQVPHIGANLRSLAGKRL